MIKKIVSIKNTGKFRNLSLQGKGDIQFNRMNVIYSENGRGKTTLSNIFRSLNDQNKALVIGRKTLGGTGEQSIEILCDSMMCKFRGEEWERKPNFEIEIFDSMFVSHNVFSKNIIEHDQKKHMYLFTIGKEGVEKATKYDEIEAQIKKITSERKALESSIKDGIQGVLSLNDFIGLPIKENLEAEISRQEQLLSSHGKEAEIKTKSTLSKIDLPSFDKIKFVTNLAGNTLESILDNAELLTKQHIKDNLDDKGEKWLEYGVSKIKQDQCPFCKQNIRDNEIVTAYKTYFSDEYKKAIQSVSTLENAFAQRFNFERLSTVHTLTTSNLELLSFWKKYVTIDEELSLDIAAINSTWNLFNEGIKQIIELKKRSPLEKLLLPEETEGIIDKYQSVLEIVADYNKLIDEMNKKIDERKSSFNQHTAQNAKVSLERLKNTKLRHSEPKIRLIEQYQSLSSSIEKLNSSKKQIKDELNTYTEKIFSQYEDRINWHLESCGANFKVSDYKSNFQGGKPSSNFTLSINNVQVPLGSSNTPLHTPNFGNTLSEGDKSSLAFAFFLAKLETDQTIDSKVIIFDDPISSLDNHRKTYTADQVIRFSNKAKQVIVLTHDTFFARILWDRFADKKTLLTQLRIKREGANDSTIDYWDIEEQTRSDYYQSYFALADFLEGKSDLNLRAVAMCIRPLLEGNLRIRFPQHFKSNEWLGSFIDHVRTATAEPLLQLKLQLDELESINDYSKKYHHDKNQFADSEPVNELELMAYVKRTLNVLNGVHSVSF